MHLNGKQVIGIVIAVLSVLMVSTAQLQDLFGPTAAKTVQSLAGLMNAILGAAMATITSQTAQVNDVAAMPGIESITVNRNASQALATIAMDPTASKVEVKAGDSVRVQNTAGGVE